MRLPVGYLGAFGTDAFWRTNTPRAARHCLRLRQNLYMAGRVCFHCKQWVEEGEAHDCWTTTEIALTRYLSDDLREAWERLRETAVAFGDQRIYASHKSIMFSRKTCHFFVRPKQRFLEVCIFLDRTLKAPQIQRAGQASKSKQFYIIRITHRDEVESPITDWLHEAYELSGAPPAASKSKRKSAPATPSARER